MSSSIAIRTSTALPGNPNICQDTERMLTAHAEGKGRYQLWQKWQTMSAQTGAFEKSCFQGMAVPSLCRPAKRFQTSHSRRLLSQGDLLQSS